MDENYYEMESVIDPTLIVLFITFGLAVALIAIVSQWRIFTKAG